MNLSASFLFSSAINLSAGLSSDNSILSKRLITIAKSAPSVEPLNVGTPISLVISLVPFLINPGTKIKSISFSSSEKFSLISFII